MKYRTGIMCTALAVAGALFVNSAISQDKQSTLTPTGKTQNGAPDMEAMMKKCEEAATPGAAHKALEALVGDWTTESKCFMPGSEAPQTSKGNNKSTWALGNRYVRDEFTGEFMGKPFHGVGYTGYDNTKQKYVSVWMDDMSTTMFATEGTVDSSGKKFTFEGTVACPITGEKNKAMKFTLNIVSPTKHIFEMHDPSLGEKSKMMEITYTKK